MSLNGKVESSDDSVICIDTSHDTSTNNDTAIENASEILHVNFDKTLPPGVAPEGFIVLDESIDMNEDEAKEKSTESTLEKEEPMIKVIFQNEAVACQYRKRIRDFLQDLLSANLTNESSNCSDLVLEIKITDLKPRNSSKNSKIDDQSLFMVDNTPGYHDVYNVPTYGKKFERVLTEAREDLSGENDDKGPRLNCFNCLGNHNLRDCPEPKNHTEINKNRKEFMSKSGPRNVRYHIDQKFTPGFLSPELRKALGLSNDELPKHIYKMRLMGYPPGWLEEAKLQHSGLNLYNSDGHREVDPKEEVGEIFCPESLTEYDIKKIHDFPGYNVPPPVGTRDAYWSADQQTFHSKETMLQTLSHQKAEEGYKRKKLKRTNNPSADAIVEPIQMDIDALEDPKSPKSSGELSESPSPDCGYLDTTLPSLKTDTNEVSVNSPSLMELETRKKRLLEELNDSNSFSNPSTPVKSINNSTIETPSLNETPSTSTLNFSCENTPKVGSVKSVELGTPLIEQLSVYTKLPSSEKFSKDICDVINFENLPGSTGKYEKMSGIIQKIRTTLTPQKD